MIRTLWPPLSLGLDALALGGAVLELAFLNKDSDVGISTPMDSTSCKIRLPRSRTCLRGRGDPKWWGGRKRDCTC